MSSGGKFTGNCSFQTDETNDEQFNEFSTEARVPDSARQQSTANLPSRRGSEAKRC